MDNWLDQLKQEWRSRLARQQPPENSEVIIKWLIGEHPERLLDASPQLQEIIRQAMDYRYRILIDRYLDASPAQCYQRLISRLGSLMLLRNKIRTWVSLSRDRQRAVGDVLQEVVQEILHSDRYIQSQIRWAAECTTQEKLRNALLLTSVEEYCLRPIRNQPLIVYRFVNYLRRSQRSGMTNVPEGSIIKFFSDEVIGEDSESPLSLLDEQAVAKYQDEQAWEQQQLLRASVAREFGEYLQQNLGEQAAQWFKLYLQGQSPEGIARVMGIPVKQIYRLREKVSYHASRVFALKSQPELVASWLEISAHEHSLGLTGQQWQQLSEQLTHTQNQVLIHLRSGKDMAAIAQELDLKLHQVLSEWGKIYLAAQSLRSG
jgi:DNA-binding CsgD family transcriptional regulator